MSTTTKPITADELYAMGDIGRCELIYGELVMMSPAGAQHGMVALRIGRLIAAYVDEHDLGAAFAAETGFIIEQPDLVRAPDAAFVRKDRLAAGMRKEGFFEGVPDLAVEVVSPGESKREVVEKVNMWLAGGTTSCWVADPATRSVTIHRTGQPPTSLTGDAVLSGEPTLPGFSANVALFFKLPGRPT